MWTAMYWIGQKYSKLLWKFCRYFEVTEFQMSFPKYKCVISKYIEILRLVCIFVWKQRIFFLE